MRRCSQRHTKTNIIGNNSELSEKLDNSRKRIQQNNEKRRPAHVTILQVLRPFASEQRSYRYSILNNTNVRNTNANINVQRLIRLSGRHATKRIFKPVPATKQARDNCAKNNNKIFRKK